MLTRGLSSDLILVGAATVAVAAARGRIARMLAARPSLNRRIARHLLGHTDAAAHQRPPQRTECMAGVRAAPPNSSLLGRYERRPLTIDGLHIFVVVSNPPAPAGGGPRGGRRMPFWRCPSWISSRRSSTTGSSSHRD